MDNFAPATGGVKTITMFKKCLFKKCLFKKCQSPILTPVLYSITFTTLLSGCQPYSDSHAKPQANSQADKQNAQTTGQEVAEKLQVSYARASAYTSNECPKLIEFQFSNQSITRQDERFPKHTCDYFVYLRQGEILKIDVSREVKAELVSPVNFDFANGSYSAPKYDKYTVRLSYDGTRFHPNDFKYDVILTKAKSTVKL